MTPPCPHCELTSESPESRTSALSVIRTGHFYRQSDTQRVQRFRCLRCLKNFSEATLQPCYWQKKRHLNTQVRNLLCSCVSQRRTALLLTLNRKTVVQKFRFLAQQAALWMDDNRPPSPLSHFQFDDMETHEHTKCKPLSITIAVEHATRRILGIEVSVMPAKGTLAALSRKKYGPRPDERPQARKALFARLKAFIAPIALIQSDQNPHYREDVKKHFPEARHETFKGRRGAIVGQGELKKIGFDPLFSLNHTCAMIRDNVNRLKRKTWATTKKAERLAAHLILYAQFHNEVLLKI